MRSKFVSAASIIQLVVATVALAVCLNLCAGLSRHEAWLERMYGDRVFSLRAVATESGAPYRFDRNDIDIIQKGLESEGIIVAGLGLSYIDAREVGSSVREPSRGSLRGSLGSYRPRGRVLLADVTPLYFEIAGLALSLGDGESSDLGASMGTAVIGGLETSKGMAAIQDFEASVGMALMEGLDASKGTAMQDGTGTGGDATVQSGLGADLCVISDDLSRELFGTRSSGQTLTVSGGRRLAVVAQVSGDHLVPMVDEPTGSGLVHRLGHRVIYRPLSDVGAPAGFGYLLFKIREGISPMDGMKSVSRFMVTHYPELQIDVYSEYERFAGQSEATRSVLIATIVAVFIGYAVAAIGVYASESMRVKMGYDGISIMITLGSPPHSVAALVVRRAVVSSVFSGMLGCLLYLVVSAVGQSLPGLPAEVIGTAVAPAIVSVAVTVLTATVASLGPARKASMVSPMLG